MYIKNDVKKWGETISIKNMTLLVSLALIFLFLISSVSAVDTADLSTNASDDALASAAVEDENLSASASEDNALEANNALQEATFSKPSQSNYLMGDTFDVKLLDKNNKGIANKTVYFDVKGKIFTEKTDANGLAKLKLNFKNKGAYTIKFYINDSDYKQVSASKDILLLSTSATKYRTSSTKVYAGVKQTFRIALYADGIPLAGRTVKFVIDKKAYIKKTSSTGRASLTVYLSKGNHVVKYYFAGEKNIDVAKNRSTISAYYLKNPYGTKYRTVLIDADGGFTKAFLNNVAKMLRKAGWKVIVKGIGPGQHSINYKTVKNAVYMPFYNGMCAGTIKEMVAGYYGGVIKKNKAVLAPSWYTEQWTKPDGMLPYRYDITKLKFLKRAWDDNFSPASFKGIKNPAKLMTDNGIKYTVGDTAYMIVEQFLYGGWVAHH